jgi:dTDP-4-amino-4,6-dideoxygalactose transaminase
MPDQTDLLGLGAGRTAERRVPFNRATVSDHALAYVAEALHSLRLAGNGIFTERCATLLASLTGARTARLTGSCTHSLEMAALLLEAGPGDEVIVPAFTYVSTANAFAMHGFRPVFADCRPDTLNLDASLLPRLVSPRTRAVVAVHYAGIASELDEVLTFARERNLIVIEDAAHGLFGRYRGRSLGSFGHLGALSFHETKNVTCGQGGALLINDERFTARAEILQHEGTDRRRFLRGEVDRYQWLDRGSNWVLSEPLAALLWSQLEIREQLQAQRHRLWNAYDDALADWASANDVRQPVVPPDVEHPAHLYYLLLPTARARTGLIRHLDDRGIQAVFHYLPLNASPAGQATGAREGDCPVAESVSARLVRLPLNASMTAEDHDYVVSAVRDFAA